MLFWTRLLLQLMLIPSAHSWNASEPQGPMSLFCTVTLLHCRPPSWTCRQDHERGSHECTYSMSCPVALEPPNSMFAPPPVGGAPARVPLIYGNRIVSAWKATEENNCAHLDVAQLHTAAESTRPVHSSGVPRPIIHGPIDYEYCALVRRTCVGRGVSCSGYLLVGK